MVGLGKLAVVLSIALWICAAVVCAIVYPVVIDDLREERQTSFLQKAEGAFVALGQFVDQRLAVMTFLAGSLGSYPGGLAPRSLFDDLIAEAIKIGVDDINGFVWAAPIRNVSQEGPLYASFVESSYPGVLCHLEPTNSTILGDAVWPILLASELYSPLLCLNIANIPIVADGLARALDAKSFHVGAPVNISGSYFFLFQLPTYAPGNKTRLRGVVLALLGMTDFVDAVVEAWAEKRLYHVAMLSQDELLLYWDGPSSWNGNVSNALCSNLMLANNTFVTVCIVAAAGYDAVFGFTPLGFMSVILFGGVIAMQLLLRA